MSNQSLSFPTPKHWSSAAALASGPACVRISNVRFFLQIQKNAAANPGLCRPPTQAPKTPPAEDSANQIGLMQACYLDSHVCCAGSRCIPCCCCGGSQVDLRRPPHHLHGHWVARQCSVERLRGGWLSKVPSIARHNPSARINKKADLIQSAKAAAGSNNECWEQHENTDLYTGIPCIPRRNPAVCINRKAGQAGTTPIAGSKF